MSKTPENTLSKYYVRFSTEADIDKIVQFYIDNAHKNVMDRKRPLLEQLVRNGSVTLIESEDGKIVASSISYPIMGIDKGEEKIKWTEVGSTRIVLNGYPGLFNVMIAAQALRTFLCEPPADRLVAEMATAPVQGLAQNLGWRRWKEPPEEMVHVSYDILASNEPKAYNNWFHCGVEAMPTIAKYLLEVMKDPVLVHKKTGEKIQIDFGKSQLAQMFRASIESLAKKDYGSPDTPNMQYGLAQHRRNWLKTLR